MQKHTGHEAEPALITRADIERASARLGMLEFWPASPATRAEISVLLARMVPHREALEWLVDELVNRVGRWPGPREVRGILCSRYNPADGIDAWSTLPGYTADDGEARYLAEHQTLAASSQQLVDTSERIVRQLAAAKQLPPAPSARGER